ncbi:hypothetical protein Tco_1481922, partial [Tanacetum coccineum]
MRTLFKSQDLWDLVENGLAETGDEDTRSRENQKRDAKALFFIQQAVEESIFSRIAEQLLPMRRGPFSKLNFKDPP